MLFSWMLLLTTMMEYVSAAGFLIRMAPLPCWTGRCTLAVSSSNARHYHGSHGAVFARETRLFLSERDRGADDDTAASSSSSSPLLVEDEAVGGYTTKQRLREEIESPFRKVRLLFFASTTGSALTALYFSTINAIKAASGISTSSSLLWAGGGGGETALPPPPSAVTLEEALSACAVNLVGAIVCALLAYREYQVGQGNLERIRKGGLLASLVVVPATTTTTTNSVSTPSSTTTTAAAPARRRPAVALKDYRRSSRVVIAAGGRSYLSQLCRQLNSDQLQDENTLPQAIESVNLIVVPVLLEKKETGEEKGIVVAAADTQATWLETVPVPGVDRNFDVNRANAILAFPYPYRGNVNAQQAWSSFLESEIDTAQSQGFNVLEKGFTITVKKNGRILRRATGLPPWSDLIGSMEVLDGKFGMPGDDER